MNRPGLAGARRAAWLARLRASAAWERAGLDLDVAGDVRLGRGIRVTLRPRTANVLRIGPQCVLGDRVTIDLRGGRVTMADHVEIQRDATLIVTGRLELAGANVLQSGASVHCDEAVELRRGVVLGEQATVVDSAHHHTAPDEWVHHNVTTRPVVIGAGSWIGAKATVSRGVTIGDGCIVTANSLVVSDVPDGQLASGVPAEVVRPVTGRDWPNFQGS